MQNILEIFKEQNILIVIFNKEKGSAKFYRSADPGTHRCSHYKFYITLVIDYILLEVTVISKFLLSNDKIPGLCKHTAFFTGGEKLKWSSYF